MTAVTVRCVGCGGNRLPFPPIQAPAGYAFDATKVLVTCQDCGRTQTVDECVETA